MKGNKIYFIIINVILLIAFMLSIEFYFGYINQKNHISRNQASAQEKFKNLFDREKLEIGYAVNQENGKILTNQYFCVSNFIKIAPYTEYIISRGNHIAYYNKEYDFLGGEIGYGQVNYNIITPLGTEYLRFDVLLEEIDSIRFSQKESLLNNKSIVNFGDSIFGATQDCSSVSNYIGFLSGAKTYNIGFGGCKMSSHDNTVWSVFSMCSIADAITSRDFSKLEDAVNSYDKDLPYYFKATVSVLKDIEFNSIDYITIAYGTNDYTAGVSIQNENEYDLNTFIGVLTYSIEKIKKEYPNLKILVITPQYRYWLDENSKFLIDSNVKQINGVTMRAFSDAIVKVCSELYIAYLDDYGIRKENYIKYFPENDGTHHNAEGRYKIAESIVCAILAI